MYICTIWSDADTNTWFIIYYIQGQDSFASSKILCVLVYWVFIGLLAGYSLLIVYQEITLICLAVVYLS